MRRRLALAVLSGAVAGCSALIGLGDYSVDRDSTTTDGGETDAPFVGIEDAVTIDVPVIPAPPGCGDGKSDPGEECDDGNREPYDGCSPFCKRELLCNTSCPANCGDGFRVGKEACDDGNLIDGDGCSKTCEVETGFTCADTELAPPSADLVVPVIYRDMRYRSTPNGHPDFQRSVATVRGLVNDQLDVAGPVGRPTLKRENTAVTTTVANFCWWYHDQGCIDGGANPFARRVTSDQAGNPTALVFQTSGTDAVSYSNSKFFPINGLGWDSQLGGQFIDAAGCTPERNYSFTTELHYPFQYAGGEKIDFKGDDDVWIFVNGRLVIDLGGVHGPESESLDLAGLGLLKGAAYDLAVFHAERYVCESNFIMTLTKFHRTVSKCTK